MTHHGYKQRCWLLTVLPTYESGIEDKYLVPTHELNKEQRRLLLTDITWREIIESGLFKTKPITERIVGILLEYKLDSNEVDNVYRQKSIRDILKKNSIVNMLDFYSYNPPKV